MAAVSNSNTVRPSPSVPRSDAAAPAAPSRDTAVSKPDREDAFTTAAAHPAEERLSPSAPVVKSASVEQLFGGVVREEPALSAASGKGPATSYTVQAGDTLSGIAERFGSTVDTLARTNNISNPDRIYVGQVLSIPGTDPVTPPPAPAPSTTYMVQAGDTLSGIADRFGTTVDSLARTNNISNPNLIYPGQVLTIPGAGPIEPPPAPGPGGAGSVSLEQLRAIMPNLSAEKAQQYLPHLNAAMAEARIDTPARQAAFLAQLAHESGEFRWMEELATGDDYEGRLDLGNTEPGDGRRFKGRGPIQLTGRSNYAAASRALGVDLVSHPELAATPEVGFRVAGWYWTTHGLNEKADRGDFTGITRAINGGLNGQASREAYWNRAKQVLATIPGGDGGADFRSRALQAAQSQVGNWDMYRYLNGHGPEAWCNDFVSWSYQQAGKPLGPDGWYRYVPYMQNWLQQTGQWIDRNGTPSPGDIVNFDWDSDGVPDHTGIVKGVNPDGTITTIEGNVHGSNDWNGVLDVLVRSRNTITGFGHLR